MALAKPLDWFDGVDRVPRVTLLGDAARLKNPSGEGADLALFTASEQAR